TAAHQDEKRKSEALAAALDELKNAQDRLVVQQKLASLGTLTAGIAHEIKNPLNFVTNFAEILRSLIGDLRESLVSQQVRIDPAIPVMNVVPHDLSRVILNLVNNGGFAADQRAKRAGPAFRPTLRITTRHLDTHVEIRIRDNGDGIPEEILPRIFEPFFTTKP